METLIIQNNEEFLKKEQEFLQLQDKLTKFNNKTSLKELIELKEQLNILYYALKKYIDKKI